MDQNYYGYGEQPRTPKKKKARAIVSMAFGIYSAVSSMGALSYWSMGKGYESSYMPQLSYGNMDMTTYMKTLFLTCAIVICVTSIAMAIVSIIQGIIYTKKYEDKSCKFVKVGRITSIIGLLIGIYAICASSYDLFVLMLWN